jgi:DNA-binding SARP family transcriptional activator
MTGFSYEILPVSYSGDMKKLRDFKKIVANIIFDSPDQTAVLNKLKEIQLTFPELPVLMIADSPSQEEIINAFRMGVSDFLVLPIGVGELISCLNRHTWSQRNNLNISDIRLIRKWNSIKQSFYNLIRRLRLAPPIKVSSKHMQTSLNSSILPMPIMTGNLSSENGFSIQMLGRFKIMYNGKKEIRLKGQNAKSLLAYFFNHRKRPIHREKLMTMFWPDSLPESARNCLNVTIYSIRKIFQPVMGEKEIIIYKDECYSFHPDRHVEIDVEQFNLFWRKGLAYENTQNLEKSIDFYYKAVALYKGDFIEDLLYQQWSEGERENLKERYLVILDRLSLYSFRKGDYKSTVELCNIMLKKDNCLEEIHRRLIASYRALGSRDKAIKQFTKCSETLKKELGIEPSQTTRELFDKIRT